MSSTNRCFEYRAEGATLCHKEPSNEMPIERGFGCRKLCLYGIRELAKQQYDLNQWEHSVWRDLDQWEYSISTPAPPQSVISRLAGCGSCRHYSQADTETLSSRTSQLITGICRGDRAALGKLNILCRSEIFSLSFVKYFHKVNLNIFNECVEIFSMKWNIFTEWSEIFPARGITLIESTERRSQVQARLLVNKLLTQNRNKSAQSFRLRHHKQIFI